MKRPIRLYFSSVILGNPKVAPQEVTDKEETIQENIPKSSMKSSEHLQLEDIEDFSISTLETAVEPKSHPCLQLRIQPSLSAIIEENDRKGKSNYNCKSKK